MCIRDRQETAGCLSRVSALIYGGHYHMHCDLVRYRKKVAAIYQLSLIRATAVFRTVREDAVLNRWSAVR